MNPPPTTSQFGKYALQRKLAEGGMAEVFLAKQTGMEGFEKLVVVKRILPQLCSDDSFVKMFLNEARVAARLNHPNVVQIFDLGKLGDQYFIAMEYVHGEDLRAVIREATDADNRPPIGLVCRIIADMLGGLHYAHTRVGADGKPLGLVHRDVSPQNVLVTYEGSVKLVDFGIAKATRAIDAAQTQAGLLKGKYAYMSPEQARGQPVDARSDVFCVGVLLWELATWQRLFKRPTEMSTLMAVAEEPIRAPSTVEPSLPPDLDRLIVKALARTPDQRFASAQELRAALENLIRTSGWEADTLALSSYMRELFAKKLRQQAADVAAAGLASLEDFLLTIEEKTSISWMAPLPAGGDRKTPSTGLPQSRPVSGPLPATPLYGDGETVQVTEVAKGGPPIVDGIPRASPVATTLKGGNPVPTLPAQPAKSSGVAAKSSGVIVPSLSPLKATPTAATAGVIVPEAPAASDTPSMNVAPADNPMPALLASTAPMPVYGGDKSTPIFGTAKSTAKSAAIGGGEPSPMRRILVAGSAAALVAAVALTIAFWPAKDTSVVPPTGTSAATTSTTTSTTMTGTTTANAGTGTPSGGKASYATLQIAVDAPANIAVDGQAQPMGESATVNVQPGVEHVVTVQRPGHSVRKLHVPALAPGEHMPLKFSVR
ncbi:MAG TPA: protein kinase [Polyangia bacterium]|nr:protein kinase [Polyangia bacterium]